MVQVEPHDSWHQLMADRGEAPRRIDASVCRRRPATPRRSTTLTAEQRRLIFDSANDQTFKDLLLAAELTGVRPQDIRRVEARHFDEGKIFFNISVQRGAESRMNR